MNMYRETRDKLGLTREQASELLETIEPSKLERIESEKQIPNPEDVMIMAEKYGEPGIMNYFCASQCPMGQKYVPRVEYDELEKTVLKIVSSLNSMNAKQDKLIEIAEDGEITDDELVEFINIEKELARVSMAISKMEIWREQMLSSGLIDRDKYEALKNK